MLQNLAVGIVRILAPDGCTAGTGFIVHESGLIATCAHVVWPRPMRERGYPRPDSVRVVFHASGEERTARVVQECWRDPDAEDVAILQLEGPLPEGITPLPLGSSRHSRGHDFFSWGYRLVETFPEGLAAEGRIQARVRYGARDALQLLTSQIDAGMSGAPLWDVQGRRVVGMVNAFWETHRHQDAWLALAIPAETLRAVCPLLSLSDLCPYRGLEPFTEADAEFFFGRARAAESLVERLQREPRFLAILGPSGSGKSSLVQAGLIPRLRRGAIPGSDRWAFILTRPARNPFGELEARGLEGASQGLVEAVRNWLNRHPEAERLVLVVDQFEELLVDSPEAARRDFVAGLAALLDSPLPVTVILVMRDDFYSRFVREAGPLVRWLERGLANVPLGLEREDLRAIVEEPARAVGLALEEGLTEVIVRDAMEAAPEGTPGTVLPLLEFALTQLWERREEGMLTHDACQRVGSVTGGLTRWADGVFSGLSEEEQRLARQVLTDMVHLGDESQGIPDSRRRRTLEELSRSEGEREAVHGLVRRLADARLLVTGRDAAGRETAELIHDALLREWGRFQEWLREDRRFLAWRQALEGRVEEWRERGQDPDLLLRGALLTEALDWLSRREEDIAPAAREFIRRSQERAEAERQARERLRRRITLGLVTILIITFLVALFAWIQRDQVLHQQQIAHSRQLVLRGQLEFEQLPEGPFIATVLGIESLHLLPSVEGYQLVRRGMSVLPRKIAQMHHYMVRDLAFSPDGRWVVSGGWDRTVRVWEAATGREINHMVHDGEVRSVAFSPDGQRVAGASDRSIRVWDSVTGREIVRLEYDSEIYYFTFTQDGRYLLIQNAYGEVLWDVQSGSEVTHLAIGEELLTVVFGPDGPWMVIGEQDNVIRLWDVQNDCEIARVVPEKSVYGLAFSPDRRKMVTGSEDGTVQVWDTATGLEIARMSHDSPVVSVAFSPDGRWVASAGGGAFDFEGGGEVRVWEAETGHLVSHMAHNAVVLDVTFSPDGQWVVSVSDDGMGKVWQTADGREIVLGREIPGRAPSMIFTPDGKGLVVSSCSEFDEHLNCVNSEVRILEMATGREVNRMVYRGKSSVILSPNGRLMAAIFGDESCVGWGRTCYHYIEIWEVATGRKVANLVSEFISDVVFSPSGRWIAIAGEKDEIIQVWDTEPATELMRIEKTCSTEFAFSPDGQQVAAGSICIPPAIRVWEITSGQEIAQITTTMSGELLAVSINGRRVAVGTRDGVRVWDSVTGQEVLSIPASDFSLFTFSSDGQLIAGSSFNILRVWETVTGREIARMTHENSVHAITFSPDGQWVAGGGLDYTVVWATTTGREIARMAHRGGTAEAVAFSPDGQLVAIGSSSSLEAGIVRVFEVRTGQEIAIMFCDGLESVAFSPDGNWVANGGCAEYIKERGTMKCRRGVVQVWEAITGRKIAQMSFDDNVLDIAFSPDGRFLANCIGDHSVLIWEVTSKQKLVRMYSGARDWVGCAVAFSPDGRWIASITDLTLRVWDTDIGRYFAIPKWGEVEFQDGIVEETLSGSMYKITMWVRLPEDLIAEACRRLPRNLTREEWARYVGPGVPYRPTCPNLPVPGD